jgi:hypothetical protein
MHLILNILRKRLLILEITSECWYFALVKIEFIFLLDILLIFQIKGSFKLWNVVNSLGKLSFEIINFILEHGTISIERWFHIQRSFLRFISL